MTKKAKYLFRISILLNAILAVIVAWGIYHINYVAERVLTVDVAHNLYSLEYIISHQVQNDWSDPSLVTTELEQVLSGIQLSQNVGSESRTLSKQDIEALDDLLHSLYQVYQVPLPSLDNYNDLSEEDKEKFAELGAILRETGFDSEKVDMFVWDESSFIKQVDELTNNTKKRLGVN